MAFTTTQLDALDAAIVSGTLRVTYDGKTVEYRSMSEMMRARALVAAGLAKQAGTTPDRRRYTTYRSGL